MTELPSLGDRGAGVPLTEHERRRIDFTRTSVVHARWCKAAAWAFDVGDWAAYYDHSLSVGEHVRVYQRASADPGGRTIRETPRSVLGAPPARRRDGGDER